MVNIQDLIARIQQQQYQRQFPVGMAPPFPQRIPTPGVPQNMPAPTMSNHMVQPGSYGAQAQGLLGNPSPGAYGQQAQQLAGLLGGQGPLPVGMAPPYTPGRFMPGFRPGVDTPIPRSSPGRGGVLGLPTQRR